MTARALLGLLLTPTFLAPALGCSSGSRVVSFAPPPEAVSAKDYEKVRDRWTRSGKIFQPKTLDTTLRVHATLYGPEFVSAYVAMSTKLFRLPPHEQVLLKRRLDDETARGHIFFIGASTSDVRWNDFERKPSVWQIVLVNDQQDQVTPDEVRPERELTPTITELFPYVDDFYRAYTIRFPKQPAAGGRPLLRGETERLTLRFSGALGQADLEWRLR
jgi:hypothetical protein